jgi:hypothetical protein
MTERLFEESCDAFGLGRARPHRHAANENFIAPKSALDPDGGSRPTDRRALLLEMTNDSGPVGLRLGPLVEIAEVFARLQLVQQAVAILPIDALKLAGYDSQRKNPLLGQHYELVVLPEGRVGSPIDLLLADIFSRSGLPPDANAKRIARLRSLAAAAFASVSSANDGSGA